MYIFCWFTHLFFYSYLKLSYFCIQYEIYDIMIENGNDYYS